MPEIPEVIHNSTVLDARLRDKKLEKIVIHRGPYLTSEKEKYSNFRESVYEYQPHIVKEVKTKGKFMYLLLEGRQYHALGIYHGMGGSWCTDSTNKHIILELIYTRKNFISFSSDSLSCSIFFQDSRRFGLFEFLSEKELKNKLKKIGPDVFFHISNYIEFWTMVNNTKRITNKRLCEVLVDQTFISGIGNYLRADIMYEAKLDPQRLIGNLSGEEIFILFNSIKKIVRESYYSDGTPVGNYTSSIYYGSYKFLIYNKKTCPQGRKVESFKDNLGRTVWWVPTLQK